MTLTSTGMLTLLDYQAINLGTAAPGDGEYLSTASPKIVSNFLALFNQAAMSPQRQSFYVKPALGAGLTPSTGLTIVALGTTSSYAQDRVTDTNNITRRRQRYFGTGTTAQANAGYRPGAGTNCVTRGLIAGNGGFVTRFRVGLRTVPDPAFRLFVGNRNSANGDPGNTSEPSTMSHMVGFGKDSTDTSMCIFSNDGTGTATKIPLDVSTIPIAQGSAYEVTFACAPGITQPVAYRVRMITGLDDEGNDTFGASVTGSITTDLPPGDQFMSPLVYINNAAVASNFDLSIFSTDGVGF